MASTKQISYSLIAIMIAITFLFYMWIDAEQTNKQMIKTNCTIISYPTRLYHVSSHIYIYVSYKHNGEILNGAVLIPMDDYIKLEQSYVDNIPIDCYYNINNPTIISFNLLDVSRIIAGFSIFIILFIIFFLVL